MEKEKKNNVFEISRAEQIRSTIENPDLESPLKQRVSEISELELRLLSIYGIHFNPRDENIRIINLTNPTWLEALNLEPERYNVQVTPSEKYANSRLIIIADKFANRIEEGNAYICTTTEEEIDFLFEGSANAEKSNE